MLISTLHHALCVITDTVGEARWRFQSAKDHGRTSTRNRMEQYRGRVALVTGASSGIGAVIAQTLQKEGLVVVGMARRVDRIKELDVKDAPGKLYALQGDITKEEDILSVFKWIKDNLGGVDILVNNAGVGSDVDLTVSDTSLWKQILDVNILGLSICTREAVKGMRERGVDDGYIIHISSMAAHHQPLSSSFAMYTASKYAVSALTEGLRKDLVASKSNIRNTTISPGLVQAEFFDKMSLLKPDFLYSNMPYLLPEDVASAVVFALSQPPRVQVQEILINPTGTVYEFPKFD